MIFFLDNGPSFTYTYRWMSRGILEMAENGANQGIEVQEVRSHLVSEATTTAESLPKVQAPELALARHLAREWHRDDGEFLSAIGVAERLNEMGFRPS